MFGSVNQLVFRDYVRGTFGSFATPAGRVDYILTKARLGEEDQQPERRLTKNLSPVREVMEAEDLDFNQLLQRDLDDHRVATNLIPYLLTRKSAGPAFFPPIVAVLLPFKSKKPTTFPEFAEEQIISDPNNTSWITQDAGEAFRVRRLADPSTGKPHGIPLGELWWNDAHARLVVLDGQHRAMALLAIERTQSKTWPGSGGERFRSFYEAQVKAQLDKLTESGVALDSVEVPVTVCWFPDQVGQQAHPHNAARKLFVDVNKEARQPSESRLILLSDAELVNVLTRSLLSKLRSSSSDSYLPIYAVEYDNPEVKTTQSTRWSAVTNINLLKHVVSRCVFGPKKYLIDVTQKFGSRESEADRNSFMRTQLELSSLFPTEFTDSGFTYVREDIRNDHFPLGQADKITERFTATWGEAILRLLSGVRPYQAHAQALAGLKDKWLSTDAISTLAHDALFSGVGVYWTLRDSNDHYTQPSPGLNLGNAGKPDIVKAWHTLVSKHEEFEVLRAAEFSGSSAPSKVQRSKDAYSVFNTHACQLGMFLAMGSLWLRTNKPIKDLPEFASALVAGWNMYFSQDSGKSKDRRFAFMRSSPSVMTINVIANMDTPRATLFRYFWIEALATPEARQAMQVWLTDSDLDELVNKARAHYLEYCTGQQISALKTSQPTLGKEKLAKAGQEAAEKHLRKALGAWFSVSSDRFDQWLESSKLDASGTLEEQTGVGATVEADDSEGTGPTSLDEVLNGA